MFFAAHDKYQKVCTLHKPAFWLRIPPYERTAPQKTPFRLRISPYEWNAQVNFLPPTTNTKKSALSAKTPFELISYYMNVLYCKNRRRRFLPKLILRGFAAYHKVRTLCKNACGVFAQVNFARQRRTKFTCSRIPPYTTFPPDAKQSTQARCPPARPRRQNAR